MLGELFLHILNMSFSASVVIVFVLVVRLILRKAPKIFSYALWSVVLIRLILPFSFESPFSIIPTKTNPISRELVYSAVPVIDTGITPLNTVVNAVLPAATPIASVNPLQIWMFVGSIIWGTGIALLLLYSIVSYIKLKKRLSNAVHLMDQVYIAENLSTPFVMGVFQPRIYLPSTLTEKEIPLILLHEQTHIKRYDPLFKIIAFFALCLHWFNPLVWVAFFCSVRDMEMACDESVIKQMGNEAKKDYSQSLLSLATGKRFIAATPLAFGEGDTKKRIKNVLQYKSPKFWVSILATIVVIVIAISLISNPIKSVDLSDADFVDELWNSRTPYVGDNSAVSKLLSLMPLPEGLKHDSIKLYTNGEERGLEWILVDVDNTGFDETELQRAAILLFASIENLKEFYVTTISSSEEDVRLHYDSAWVLRILGTDVKDYYGVSPEKLQELVDLTVSALPLTKYSIAEMGPGGEVISEVVLRDPELAKTIWFDSMIKSARFEGTEISELTQYYRIRIVYPEVDETHDYYAYLLDDGTPVLQSEPEGWYSVMSAELYPRLVDFFK
jgi:beta-lactamase regulating signal transducer with metallopeptidase domain